MDSAVFPARCIRMGGILIALVCLLQGRIIAQSPAWSSVFDLVNADVSAMTATGNTLWAVTRDGAGVYRSGDGKNWSFVATLGTSKEDMLCISAVPTSGTLLIGTSLGMYRSSDNGSTWNRAQSTPRIHKILTDAPRIFAATDRGIYLTNDDGKTWDTAGLYTHNVYAIVFLNGYYFAATEDGIYKRHQTRYWPASPIAFSGRYIADLAVDENGRLFAGGDMVPDFVYYSENEGKDWDPLYDNSRHGMVTQLALTRDGRLYSGGLRDDYIASKRLPSLPWEDTQFEQSHPANPLSLEELLVDPVSGYVFACGRDYYGHGRIFRTVEPALEKEIALRVLTQPPAAVTSLWFIAPPPTVGVYDGYGLRLNRTNRMIAASLIGETQGAVLSGTMQTATGIDGLATFDRLRVDKAGPEYRLVFTAANLVSDTSDYFKVIPGNPASLQFTQHPSGGMVGEVLAAFVAEMRDSSGNRTININPSVRLSIGTGPSGANIIGTTVAVLDDGIARWTDIAVDQPGTYEFSVQGNQLFDTTPPIEVASAQNAVALRFTMDMPDAMVGEPFSIGADVVDAAGVRVLGDRREVRIRMGNNPANGVLAGTLSVNAQDGHVLFDPLSIDKIGQGYTLIVEADNLIPDTCNAFAVVPGRAVRIEITSTIPELQVDETFALDVNVLDKEGNITQHSSPVVQLVLRGGDAGAVLGGEVSRAVKGTERFSGLSVNRSGNGYTIIANAAAVVSDTSNRFDVLPPEPSVLRFQTEPVGGSADNPFPTQPIVVLEDREGRLVPLDGLDVTLAILGGPGNAVLEGGPITVSTSDGVASFSDLAIRTAASGYTLVATAAGMVRDTSQSFSISHGQEDRLRFLIQPASAESNTVIPASVVAVEDRWGNTATSSMLSVTMSIHDNPGGGTLSGTTQKNAVNGEAVFDDLRIDQPATGYTLYATASGLQDVISDAFDIGASGVAYKLVFSVDPEGGAADQPLPLQPVVSVLDASDVLVESSTAQIELDILQHPSGAALEGETVKNATQGSASFSGLRIRSAGQGYRIVARSSGLVSDTSAAIDITPGSPRQLRFIDHPVHTAVNQPISPAVTAGIFDSEGNLVDSSRAWVTLHIGTNPGDATLQGSGTRQANAGIAVFDDLALDAAGVGYTLIALSGGLLPDTSGAFNILETERIMRIESGNGQQGAVGDVLPTPLTVSVRDGIGDPVAGIRVDFSLRQPDGSTTGRVNPEYMITGFDGNASTTLTLGSRSGPYTVTASSTAAGGGPLFFIATAVSPPYPSTIQLEQTWSFPYHEDRGAYSPLDYRIIGLPGNSGIDITSLLSGAQNENWKLFSDNGEGGEPSDYLLPYDGSSVFIANVGMAFWLLHRGDVGISRTVSSAPIDDEKQAAIAIHAGWNLICNPFPAALSWTKLQQHNGITDPIYRFGSVHGVAADFDPYEGYYYFNRDGRSMLLVPYDSIYTPRRVAAPGSGWTIDILLECGGIRDRTLSFGMHPSATDILDKSDYPAPRGLGRAIFAYFSHPEREDAFAFCGRDLRSEKSPVQRWELTLESLSHEVVTLSFEGLDGLDPALDITLIDPQTREQLRLRDQPRYTLFTRGIPYRLSLQSLPRKETVDVTTVIPSGLAIDDPYPNPTSRGCVVAVSLASGAPVEITVRDVLGRTVRSLFVGTLGSPRRLLYWDGRSSSGVAAAPGLYFIHLRSGTQQRTSAPIVILSR